MRPVPSNHNSKIADGWRHALVGGAKLSGVTSVEPGSLGGVAKCGKADEKDIDLAMCGWADDGSVGWVMFFFQSVKSAQAEFPKLRAQIEKKPR